jgi:cell fate regulator YaaT (PSP1 superfamily)
MPNIVGIRFKEAGKVYYFDPGALEIAQGDWAVVETAQGRECGLVALSPRDVPEDQLVSPLKKIMRKATADDLKAVEERAGKERHALEVCEEKIRAHNLDMKLVDVEYAFDGGKIVFYFTADGRVDFRALVRDLAAVFRTRIELRQIGVRDEVKMLGGLGPCGREVCCKAFLTDFSPVSIRMAKDQNLSLNPTKISGLCGRLMCCLNYEQAHYQATLQHSPKKGATVLTPEGPATIDDVLILKEKVKVRLHGEEVEIREYLFDDVQETNAKDIAEWEASGGRARAVLAKAAYKQAQNKPKPKLDEPLGNYFSSYNEEPSASDETMEPDGIERSAGRDRSEIKLDDNPSEEEAEEELDAFTDDEEGNKPDNGSTVPPAPPLRPRAAALAPQGRPQGVAQGAAQNAAQNQQPAAGPELRRRRHRGGRRRGGFHGGPKN